VRSPGGGGWGRKIENGVVNGNGVEVVEVESVVKGEN